MKTVAVAEKFPELAVLRKQDIAIAELAEKYGGLVVSGPDDKAGFEIVKDARIHVRDVRVAIEAKRKELKADSLEYGRLVDGEAKRLFAMIEPIESRLIQQEEIVANEKKRRAEAAELAKREMVRSRMEKLAAVGCFAPSDIDLSECSEFTFTNLLTKATGEFEAKRLAEAAELQRMADERAKIEAQAKAQAELQAELDRKAEEQRKAQAAIDAENLRQEQARQAEAKRLADIELEKIRAEELERERVAAAERAIVAERERIETQQRLDKERAEREEAERIAEEKAKPYREKLQALAQQIDNLVVPAGKHSKECLVILNRAKAEILALSKNR